MANETKTEDIVRDHFLPFVDEVIVERKASDNPRITNLLRNASKSGDGPGYPDFLVSYLHLQDLLIVIECKADVNKHQSDTRKHFKDYAVDGALLYSSHLSKAHDVLAIAVSGMNNFELKVTHFLQLKGQREPTEILGNRLLSPDDYRKAYMNSPEKYRQDYQALQHFIVTLNKRLHTDKVSESNRSLLISAILIALERDSFKNAYPSESDPQRVAQMIVEAADAELADARVSPDSRPILRQYFEFLLREPVLTSEAGELKNIVKEIDEVVNSFIKNHKYRDVLGTLYIEFLRYANSDKSLGIVLTPPHITEFFAKLAQVNSDSIVYDSCAGTGGFLISAMKEMIDDAGGDSAIEERIKATQIFGTEQQPAIYSLAVSNMYIHQDGKSNVKLGDCFDEQIVTNVKAKSPTVGLLNPPYKADKKRDIEELAFVYNNVDCLALGGTCVAIVPMRCALATAGDAKVWKERLMEKHTLEAVLSMPDQLFFNSDVAVVSCIMIFSAHRPHPANKKVLLAYFKNDGFEIHKLGGRIDANGQWEEMQKQWLDVFVNRSAIPGLSVNVTLGPSDEWVPESYMDNDYSMLNDEAFDNTVFEYARYLFGSRQQRTVSDLPLLADPKSRSLHTDEWQLFGINDLFQIKGTKTTSLRDLVFIGEGQWPYVTTRASNNGVGGFYDRATETGGVLVIDSAVAGFCSYQETDFSASDHVEKLIPRFSMSRLQALFLSTVLNFESFRYNYGRKASQGRLRKASVRLPASADGEVDWEFIDEYMKRRPYSGSVGMKE
jgi:hypothetical protein